VKKLRETIAAIPPDVQVTADLKPKEVAVKEVAQEVLANPIVFLSECVGAKYVVSVCTCVCMCDADAWVDGCVVPPTEVLQPKPKDSPAPPKPRDDVRPPYTLPLSPPLSLVAVYIFLLLMILPVLCLVIVGKFECRVSSEQRVSACSHVIYEQRSASSRSSRSLSLSLSLSLILTS
jgi:hypothetical protein